MHVHVKLYIVELLLFKRIIVHRLELFFELSGEAKVPIICRVAFEQVNAEIPPVGRP